MPSMGRAAAAMTSSRRRQPWVGVQKTERRICFLGGGWGMEVYPFGWGVGFGDGLVAHLCLPCRSSFLN